MANAVTTQLLADGARNVVVLLTGVLDTSNEAAVAKIDVSTLSGAPTRVAIEKIEYSLSGSLKFILAWDATADVTFAVLAGQGTMCFDPPIRNNAGTGITGDVMGSTTGYASGTETYTVTIHAKKVSF
ncbi:MAG: hypothetical protein E6Q97_24605 [Desulfurellales bacterium]|nr:MAG: hypothetical protein E6Q97_24605 [Desulfurellales bacterium]